MYRVYKQIGKRAISVLCALSLLLAASVHRSAEAAPYIYDPDLAAYLALGGSLTDLCRSGETGDGGVAHGDCPACILAKSLALAPAFIAPMKAATVSIARTVPPSIQMT